MSWRGECVRYLSSSGKVRSVARQLYKGRANSVKCTSAVMTTMRPASLFIVLLLDHTLVMSGRVGI